MRQTKYIRNWTILSFEKSPTYIEIRFNWLEIGEYYDKNLIL